MAVRTVITWTGTRATTRRATWWRCASGATCTFRPSIAPASGSFRGWKSRGCGDEGTAVGHRRA
jgi:anti-sigma factor RsiW